MIIRDIIARLEKEKENLANENIKMKEKIEILKREKDLIMGELNSLKNSRELDPDGQKTDDTKRKKKTKIDNLTNNE